MSDKTYIDGADTIDWADTGSTPATADTATDKVDTKESTATADPVATLQGDTVQSAVDVLQTKLQQLQAKLHKEFRWYCDTILQGGSLAVRVSYKVHCAVETIEIVDRGEVRTDPALGEPMVYIGGSLYAEAEIDALLEREYLLDELYDTWCSTVHCSTEWSDCMSRLLDTLERDN